MDWIEITQKHNLDMHPDTLRKAGAGFELALKSGIFSQKQSNEEAAKIYRAEANERYRAVSRNEAIRQSIEESIRNLSPINTPNMLTKNESSHQTLVLCIADTHYGAEWEVRGLLGEVINRYNPDVFEERMWDLFSKVRKLVNTGAYRNVVVLMGGDSLDGMLRNSQLMKLRYGVVESCMRFSEFMAHWFSNLASLIQTNVYFVDGNHSEVRPLGSKRNDFPDENFERIISWYISSRCKDNENLNIINPCSKTQFIDIQGYNFLLTHGDDDKNISEYTKQSILMYGEQIDYVVCGHKHRQQSCMSGYTDSGNTYIIRVPSICGMDQYAQSKMFGGKPETIAMAVEKDYGISTTFNIKL